VHYNLCEVISVYTSIIINNNGHYSEKYVLLQRTLQIMTIKDQMVVLLKWLSYHVSALISCYADTFVLLRAMCNFRYKHLVFVL
jgi:hypothetical protein